MRSFVAERTQSGRRGRPSEASREEVTTHLHFETRAGKPSVFHMTLAEVRAAAKRASTGSDVRLTVGEDLGDLTWLKTADGLVTGNDIVADPVFPKARLTEVAPKLRWIHIIGAGIEPLLPLDWLPVRVTLTNNSGVHAQKTGEFATMALLALCYRLPELITNQQKIVWRQIFTPRIAGKTALIIGLGEMGGAAARAARNLGMKVLGVRRSPGAHRYADEVLPLSKLHKGLARADFVLIAAPLTPATTHLIDAGAIAAMKDGAGLVNVGRAGVVDYGALSDALKAGKLSGAILDVFDPEPLPATSPLWQVPNMIITPHCSSDDLDDYLPKTMDLAFENLARLRAGRQLKNVVDRVTGY